jgi:Protein of unknown function (DUF962)
MSAGQFLQWQWSGYRGAHQNKTNLFVHIIAVPLFMVATVLAFYALVRLSFFSFVLSVLGFIVSLLMQGHGHKLEPVLPQPFTSGFDFVRRILAEQWITFPRYVITGGWSKTLREGSRDGPGHIKRNSDPQQDPQLL